MGKEFEPSPVFDAEAETITEQERILSPQEMVVDNAIREKGHSMEGITRPLDWWYVYSDFVMDDYMKSYARYQEYYSADSEKNHERKEGERATILARIALRDFAAELKVRFGGDRHSYIAPELVVLDASTDPQGNVLGAGPLTSWKEAYLGAIDTLHEAVQAYEEKTLSAEESANPERMQAVDRLVRPLVVSVSNDAAFQREALEHGANAIPSALTKEDAKQLLALTAQIKASEASLFREHTQARKRAFYTQHEEDLEARSVNTADTAQELELLAAILGQEQEARPEQPLRILDVGCGTGRITVPLGEKYTVTGLDANEHFLEATKEKGGDRIDVRKGDVTDYKDAVDAETYDVVTYTWHSFLEAYGVGNTLETLTSAWLALKPGGALIFDMPTRANKGMEQGWYEYRDESGPGYVASIMDKDTLVFMLKMAGLEYEKTIDWKTQPSALYPEGMQKRTVVARKPASSPVMA